jgi:hypothetical protein
MDAAPTSSLERRRLERQSVVWGGLLAGALDIAAACIQSGLKGVSPPRVFRAVASGLLGPAAFQGGTLVAALGLLLHFIIAFGAAAVFVAAARRWRALTAHAAAIGVGYGIVVYLAMKYVVVPLSAVPMRAGAGAVDPVQLAIHITCVGLPIALVTRHFLATRPRAVPAS